MTGKKIEWSIQLEAGRLQECLRQVLPRRPANLAKVKSLPITLKFKFPERIVEVVEARHEVKSSYFPARGKWPESVQVEGNRLRALLDKFTVSDQIELCAHAGAIEIHADSFKMSIPRLDSQKSIEPKPLPSQNHGGKVEVSADPIDKRVALDDTWGFSARVPMPQHRDKLK